MSSLIPEQQTILVNHLMLQNGFSEYLLSLQNLSPQLCPATVPAMPTTEFDDLLRNLKNNEENVQNSNEKELEIVKDEEKQQNLEVEEEIIVVINKEEKPKRSHQPNIQLSSIKKEIKRRNEKKDKVHQESAPIPSIAPWSTATSSIANPPISLAEIQKAERRERRHEEQQKIVEPSINESKDNLTWTKILPPPTGTKSFAEIQAEEAKELAFAEQQKKQRADDLATNIAPLTEVTWATAWKIIPAREQQPSTSKKKDLMVKKKSIEEKKIVDRLEKPLKKDDGQTEFMSWCCKNLTNLNPKIDGNFHKTIGNELINFVFRSLDIHNFSTRS